MKYEVKITLTEHCWVAVICPAPSEQDWFPYPVGSVHAMTRSGVLRKARRWIRWYEQRPAKETVEITT